jgi:hypothetical protein
MEVTNPEQESLPLKTGYVYRIYSTSPEFQEADSYYGSTFNEPHHRLCQHKNQYSSRQRGKKVNYCYSFGLFEKYGSNTCQVEVIESIHTPISREELNSKEHTYISTMPCSNKSGKVRVKDDPKGYHKQYRQAHFESYQAYQKKYRIDNHDRLYEKTVCECGKQVLKRNLGNHLISRSHKLVI